MLELVVHIIPCIVMLVLIATDYAVYMQQQVNMYNEYVSMTTTINTREL